MNDRNCPPASPRARLAAWSRFTNKKTKEVLLPTPNRSPEPFIPASPGMSGPATLSPASAVPSSPTRGARPGIGIPANRNDGSGEIVWTARSPRAPALLTAAYVPAVVDGSQQTEGLYRRDLNVLRYFLKGQFPTSGQWRGKLMEQGRELAEHVRLLTDSYAANESGNLHSVVFLQEMVEEWERELPWQQESELSKMLYLNRKLAAMTDKLKQ
ncbi:hypothetical protein G7046_g4747 [Stylonectria norvegica]|nr:hypothetical protein G7046_g4747 [Stylonectria norvegica]